MEVLSVNFLIKDSPTAVAILDKNMCFLCHSKIWIQELKILDHNIIGKPYREVLPHTPPELLAILKECLEGETSMNQGKKFLCEDGGMQWLKWKINPWKSEDGSIGGIIVILEDITEEKRIENLLLKAQRVARIGGWEMDLTSNQLFWTEVTKEIHEVDPDFVPTLETGIEFYKKGADREKIELLVSECIATGKPWDTELKIVTANQNEIWVRAKGEAEFIEGKCVRLFGIFQDIDKKKRDELEYSAISERLKIATKAARVGIWEYNLSENIFIWDENMYPLYGIQKEDFSGFFKDWKSKLHPEDQERCQREIKVALKGNQEFKTEFRIVLPNKKVRHIKTESTIQRDEKGKALSFIGTNWDITLIKEAEIQLKNLLSITKKQNENLRNFAHIVSHNLRSHSSNLSMLTGLLLQYGNPVEDKDIDIEEYKSVLNMLKGASESLDETIFHLNEVVQIKTNIEEKMEDVPLLSAIKSVENNVIVALNKKNARCRIHVDKKLYVRAVPAYLDSILLNLFTNAIKYSHPNKVLEIEIATAITPHGIDLHFRDNGQGIDLERHGKKIFGMYKTFHNHKDARGIGLFITKNQIEAMNGQITVESTVGVGSTFSLSFTES
ncbi:PAS domain-containing protein [Spongiimicrobium salis]|uniref:PAS domain-containing protein n=1 Tax=Spongiimicrobium salis TaxID=1667022 RepID=UPI00374DE7AD